MWLINLDPTVGREIQKTRPCVVVSPPEINDHLSVMLVAPLTSGSRPAPCRVATTFAGKAGLMLLEQVRTVDGGRLVKKVGQTDRLTLSAALAVLRSLSAE
ncbi:type II toxin-antitoxin system PemK/MazF family toxin [Caulobacter sp. S45]|uniref:type II toxin-antitoxin system PemK/MazF family toxin n=1 Tax=Caulobacter sp. S45 TaxID=1641861 RepID=UPI001C2D52FE